MELCTRPRRKWFTWFELVLNQNRTDRTGSGSSVLVQVQFSHELNGSGSGSEKKAPEPN